MPAGSRPGSLLPMSSATQATGVGRAAFSGGRVRTACAMAGLSARLRGTICIWRGQPEWGAQGGCSVRSMSLRNDDESCHLAWHSPGPKDAMRFGNARCEGAGPLAGRDRPRSPPANQSAGAIADQQPGHGVVLPRAGPRSRVAPQTWPAAGAAWSLVEHVDWLWVQSRLSTSCASGRRRAKGSTGRRGDTTVELANEMLIDGARRGGRCRSKPDTAPAIDGEVTQAVQAVDAGASRAWVHPPLRW